MDDQLIDGRQADAICGTSRSKRYELMQAGLFPKPVPIPSPKGGTLKALRYSKRECHEWVQQRLVERDAG
jgi:predicted DNA-binding transcriptional regulator AlpA